MSYYYTPKQGKKTVTAAGTAEALASGIVAKSVTIQALRGNTNKVYIGTSSVSSTAYGVSLLAGETFSVSNDGHDSRINLADIYIDVDTNGEGVTYFAV